MACGCKKNKTSSMKGYIVRHPDGTTEHVTSLSAAMSTARKVRGTYSRA